RSDDGLGACSPTGSPRLMIVPQNQLPNVVATEWAIRASAVEKASIGFSHQRTAVTPGPATADDAIPCGVALSWPTSTNPGSRWIVPHRINVAGASWPWR